MSEYIEKKKREWFWLKYWWPTRPWDWRFKNIINFVDDPVDEVKHKIHGLRVFGVTIRLPGWLMRGSGKSDK